MCEFCEALKDKNKEIEWFVRSTYADDNICEYINDNECSKCNGCNMYFNLKGYNIDNNLYVGVEYNQTVTSPMGEDVIIRPFTESIKFNYCPICGQQISKNMSLFEHYVNELKIKDRE